MSTRSAGGLSPLEQASQDCRDVLALFVEARDRRGTGFAAYTMFEIEQKARAAIAAFDKALTAPESPHAE